jgi:glycosyltransferase involved in cell wall biosynthesis
MDGAPPDVPRPDVLFICADPVGERMAGLGIRCWELARALRGAARVTVAHGGSEQGERDGVHLVAFKPHAPAALRAPIARADAVVAHPQWPLVDRWLARSRARVIVDLYCPETLETLELLGQPRGRRGRLIRAQHTATTLDRLHAALRTAHNVICASETQRDLWLGSMLALRLIDPRRYDRDPSLRETIDLVPFGVPDEPPTPACAGGGVREAIPALGPASEIVLWNGGIWRWLDALTAIRAVGALSERRPGVRLVFMGGAIDATEHPAAAASTAAARALAQELGLLGSVVHFHDSWVPYDQRGAWLAQAACLLSCHVEHLETRFAYRTRLLDGLWAGVPIVCTNGDDLAERVQREQLGAVAPPGDPLAVSAGLERVLADGREPYAANLRAAAQAQTWSRVAAPLARWIAQPVPSRRLGEASGAVGPPLAQRLRDAAYLAGGRALLARR